MPPSAGRGELVARPGRIDNGILLVAARLTSPAPALACPECAEGVRRQVRAGIFDAGFGANLAATALPFAVFGGVTAWIHGGPPRPRGARS